MLLDIRDFHLVKKQISIITNVYTIKFSSVGSVNILQNVFTNRKKCDIIESAKPIKYANGYNFLLGEVYLFSD